MTVIVIAEKFLFILQCLMRREIAIAYGIFMRWIYVFSTRLKKTHFLFPFYEFKYSSGIHLEHLLKLFDMNHYKCCSIETQNVENKLQFHGIHNDLIDWLKYTGWAQILLRISSVVRNTLKIYKFNWKKIIKNTK